MSNPSLLIGAVGLYLTAKMFGQTSSTTVTPSSSSSSSSSGSSNLEERGNLKIDDWARRWQTNDIRWHKNEVNAALQKYQPRWRAQPGSDSARQPTVLVPLCGKTLDMVWLYEKGYKVVGIEIVTQAIIDFFYENSSIFPKFNVEKIPSTNIYRYSTPDGRFTILQADIFSPLLTPSLMLDDSNAAGFDAIWDRGSFQAINPHQRKDYALFIQRSLLAQGDYLLSVSEYDDPRMPGPPFSVKEDVIQQIFPMYKYQVLQSDEAVMEVKGIKVQMTYKIYALKQTL